MKNNKAIIYVGLLAIGVLLGWLFFGGSPKTEISHDRTLGENQLWTCSMHPQIMQPEPGDCPICGMDLIPFESSNEGLKANQFKLTENAMALANIETHIVGKTQTGTNNIVLSGKLQANDKSSAVQTAHFGGRIEALNFKSEGEFVNKGEVIASIYSPELVTAQNELIEAMDIKNEQPELYRAVRNKLKFWKISEEQIKQIERTKKVIANFKMYANTNGYIDAIFVEEGDHVKEGTPLFKVTNLNSVWAQLDVYEQDIKKISIGQDIVIQLNAYPDKKINAKIDFINPILNNATRTVSVRATLNNLEGTLKPGMLMSAIAKLQGTEKNNVLSIPKSAVLWTGKRSIVYVKIPNEFPVFELREVDLGNASNNNYLVLSGLENGEEIVTNGTFIVDAAAQLNGKPSMMNHVTSNKKEFKDVIKRVEVSTKFQEQFKKAVKSYLLLKDDLVNDDASSASKQAKALLVNLNKVNMKLLEDNAAHMQWMTFSEVIKTEAESLSKETDIALQRTYFKPLSSSITKAVELFGINQTIYSQFCPMADNDTGAYWLSLSEDIKNPYFGDAMLSCGNIEKTIK